VPIVAVVVTALVPATVTDEAANEIVGGSTAPDGLEVKAALRLTEPVNPFAGVTVMVEVLPEVAPATTVTAVAETTKVGGNGAVTVTVTAEEVEVANELSPA
jgi:hypothetical protein